MIVFFEKMMRQLRLLTALSADCNPKVPLLSCDSSVDRALFICKGEACVLNGKNIGVYDFFKAMNLTLK